MTTPPMVVKYDPTAHDFAAPRTADGHPIVEGMRVFTNNLDRGTVDLSRAEWHWYATENRYHLWFDVKCDTSYKGEPMTGGYQQSDDRVARRFNGKDA
jgi:hypothetical protein